MSAVVLFVVLVMIIALCIKLVGREGDISSAAAGQGAVQAEQSTRRTQREKLVFTKLHDARPVPADLATTNSFGRDLKPKAPISAAIRYVSREGEVTCRMIEVETVRATLHKDRTVTLISFRAFCHLRQDMRTFYFNAVEVAADPVTAEFVPHFGTYVWERMGRPGVVRRANGVQ